MNIFKIARKISRALTLPYKLFVKYVLTPVLSCLYRNVTFSEKKKNSRDGHHHHGNATHNYLR